MIDDNYTGDTDKNAATLAGGASFLRNTKVHEARCDAYELPYELSAVTRVSPRSSRTRKEGSRQAAPDFDERPVRYALRLHLKRARENVANLERGCQEKDHMLMADAGLSLMNELQELWRVRYVREEEWAATLNFIQAALTQEEFEEFRVEQCQAIRTLVEDYLAGGAIDEEDVTRVRLILRRAGFDPWKAISAREE